MVKGSASPRIALRLWELQGQVLPEGEVIHKSYQGWLALTLQPQLQHQRQWSVQIAKSTMV